MNSQTKTANEKKKHYSIYIPEGVQAALNVHAEANGLSFNSQVIDALEAYLSIDPVLMKKAIKMAAGVNVHVCRAISNLAIGRLAQLDADREVRGPREDLLFEFTTQDGEIIKGDGCYNLCKQIYTQEAQDRKKINSDNQRLRKENMELLDQVITLKKQLAEKV